jgi:hypothetical protein
MEKKSKAYMENQIVEKNKTIIRQTIFQDISKKKERTNQQMERFSLRRR